MVFVAHVLNGGHKILIHMNVWLQESIQDIIFNSVSLKFWCNHEEFYSADLSRKDDEKVFFLTTHCAVVRRQRNEKRRETLQSNVASIDYNISKIQPNL